MSDDVITRLDATIKELLAIRARLAMGEAPTLAVPLPRASGAKEAWLRRQRRQAEQLVEHKRRAEFERDLAARLARANGNYSIVLEEMIQETEAVLAPGRQAIAEAAEEMAASFRSPEHKPKPFTSGDGFVLPFHYGNDDTEYATRHRRWQNGDKKVWRFISEVLYYDMTFEQLRKRVRYKTGYIPQIGDMADDAARKGLIDPLPSRHYSRVMRLRPRPRYPVPMVIDN